MVCSMERSSIQELWESVEARDTAAKASAVLKEHSDVNAPLSTPNPDTKAEAQTKAEVDES